MAAFRKQMLAVMADRVGLKAAHQLLRKYQSKIDMNDSITQHIGPEYFARQILMREKLVKAVSI